MRIKKLQRMLSEKKLFGLIIDNPLDLFYLTGIELSLGRLFVDASSAHLFVDRRYFEACRKKSGISVYRSENQGFKIFLKTLQGGKKIGFDASYTSYESFVGLSSIFGKKRTLVPMERPCLSLRAVKEKKEIDLIASAALLNAQAMHYAHSLLKEGITEEEMAKKIEIFFLEGGGQRPSFTPIVAFGENAAECHYHPCRQRALKKGDCVLIDIGVMVNHYNSDLTRTYFFGNPKPQIKKIYNIVLKALQEALELCKPGTTVEELDKAARDVIVKEGYGDYFPHSLGHGVGLDIHEFPRIREGKTKLEEGMVITIEPGIYLPKRGGVRLEELIIITKKGYKNLTPSNISNTRLASL